MWRGFSFALHLLRVQGFYFTMPQYSHIQADTTVFIPSMQLYSPRCKIAHRALQWLFLRLCPLNLRKYQTDTRGYDADCTTLERITDPAHLLMGQRLHLYRVSSAAVSMLPAPGGL